MKKIGIILAALVITMFFVGAVAAMVEVTPPKQREKFSEDCCVQGVGFISYEKTILDKAIGVDVFEYMKGYTGENGSFAMTIKEVLDEGVRLNCHGNCSAGDPVIDPIYGSAYGTDPDKSSPVMVNFKCEKKIQFEGTDDNIGDGFLEGFAKYSSPSFHGGLNAQVTEIYDVRELQKCETVKMTTTAQYDGNTRDNWEGCNGDTPYNANELNYDSQNAFLGEWGTYSTWKKVCSKDIEHKQKFMGDFQVDKNLIFKEEVTMDKEPEGDC